MPYWSTVNGMPAMVSVPVRGVVTVRGEMEKLTVPEPDPLAPAVMDIHAAFELADQEQPLPEAITSTDCDPPPAPA